MIKGQWCPFCVGNLFLVIRRALEYLGYAPWQSFGKKNYFFPIKCQLQMDSWLVIGLWVHYPFMVLAYCLDHSSDGLVYVLSVSLSLPLSCCICHVASVMLRLKDPVFSQFFTIFSLQQSLPLLFYVDSLTWREGLDKDNSFRFEFHEDNSFTTESLRLCTLSSCGFFHLLLSSEWTSFYNVGLVIQWSISIKILLWDSFYFNILLSE